MKLKPTELKKGETWTSFQSYKDIFFGVIHHTKGDNTLVLVKRGGEIKRQDGGPRFELPTFMEIIDDD